MEHLLQIVGVMLMLGIGFGVAAAIAFLIIAAAMKLGERLGLK